jgi:hypothetical protein
MADDDLLIQALHALITAYDCVGPEDERKVVRQAVEALQERLARPEPDLWERDQKR